MISAESFFFDHGWDLPKGLQTYGQKDPLNFTLSEWQQAQRIGVDPRKMKPIFQLAWEQSDDLKSLRHALGEKGLYLAKGDRRGFVALDINGNVHALARWSGVKTKEFKAKLGLPDDLPTVETTHQNLKSQKPNKSPITLHK